MIDPEIANERNIDAIRMNKMDIDAVRDHYSCVQATMMNADLCTASTKELAWHMLRQGKSAIVLPNGFDEETYERSHLAWRKRQNNATDGLFRIGYAGGSRTHQADLRQCIGAVADFLRARPDARLVLFRKGELPTVELADFAEMKLLESQIEWREVVPLRDLPDEIARFDINLAPLEVGNPFCEAKSELKIFEAALAHVCTVASPTGPFARLVRDGTTGLLARTTAEWRDALFTLANDSKLRESLALAAELSVLWPHGPMRRRNAVAELLEHASGGHAATRAMRLYIAEQEKASAWAQPVIGHYKIVFVADKFKASRVTVVVPLYNYEKYVIEALDSVAAQSLADLDLVVVNDASTDASLDVVVEWANKHAERFNRILVVSHLESCGLGTARNTGFALACSLWIMALDADNRLRRTCCARCLEVADSSGAAFVYPMIRQFGDQTGTFGGEPFLPAGMLGGNRIDAMALISKEAWAAVGGYATMRLGWEDYDFWLRLIEWGLHGEPITELLAEYRVHNKSMLRTLTDKPANKKALIELFEREHPWVQMTSPLRTSYRDLESPATTRVAPKGRGGRSAAGGGDRLEELLPILRCPKSGGPIERTDQGLRTTDSSLVWPIVAGRPNFFAGLDIPKLHSDEHVSHQLEGTALDLLREIQDEWVLNLSAGGTDEKPHNVVEVEAAVFRNTDLIADVHALPFAENSFAAVIAFNAFEHYRNPMRAAEEIFRVLKPGGRVLIRTAFLQPLHEAPFHFYGCTKHGLLEWFKEFDMISIEVSDNFTPIHALAWIASECHAALRRDLSNVDVEAFSQMTIEDLVRLWRVPAHRNYANWRVFEALTPQSKEISAAGFQYFGRKPLGHASRTRSARRKVI